MHPTVACIHGTVFTVALAKTNNTNAHRQIMCLRHGTCKQWNIT